MLFLSLLAQAAAEQPTSKNPIVPELNELIYSLIAFVVLVVLFRKFGFPAVQKAMEARTERIRDDLDKAESAKTEAEGILADYKKQLSDAKAESDKIIDEARKSAEKVKEGVIAKTNEEVGELKEKNLDRETNKRLIDSFIVQVGS